MLEFADSGETREENGNREQMIEWDLVDARKPSYTSNDSTLLVFPKKAYSIDESRSSAVATDPYAPILATI
jgi:hypothetical protein